MNCRFFTVLACKNQFMLTVHVELAPGRLDTVQHCVRLTLTRPPTNSARDTAFSCLDGDHRPTGSWSRGRVRALPRVLHKVALAFDSHLSSVAFSRLRWNLGLNHIRYEQYYRTRGDIPCQGKSRLTSRDIKCDATTCSYPT